MEIENESQDKRWFVITKDEGDRPAPEFSSYFGPFKSEAEASRYADDLLVGKYGLLNGRHIEINPPTKISAWIVKATQKKTMEVKVSVSTDEL